MSKPRLFVFNVAGSPISADKQKLQTDFANAALNLGTECHVIRNFKEIPKKHKINYKHDFALIWGYSPISKGTRRHWILNGGNTDNIIYNEGDVLKAFEKKDYAYYRLPLGHIYSNKSDYMPIDENTIDKKINHVLSTTNIKIEPWKQNSDGHILIYMNRGGMGWGHFGISVWPWLVDTVNKIRQNSDRLIIVKDHPGRDPQPIEYEMKVKAFEYFQRSNSNVDHYHLKTRDLNLHNDELLLKAHSTVILGSTAGAVSLLHGIPSFCTHEQAFIHPWRCGEIENIENPIQPDRNDFLRYYANSHWDFKEEIVKGIYWKKLLKYKRYEK